MFFQRVRNEIGDFKMDNLKDEKNEDILGLFQESYNPIGLHVDAGFNTEEIIYKQTLIPLTPKGGTVIFKNKFYGNSTNPLIKIGKLRDPSIEEIKINSRARSARLRIAEKR